MEIVLETHARTSSLERLVRAHQVMVWRYLRLLGADAVEADDMMQETFLQAAGPCGRGEIRAPAAFLRRIAKNVLRGARRARHRRPPTEGWTDAVDAMLAADAEALVDQRLDALGHCLARLTGRARQAVELHHLDGMSYADTAQRLGLRQNGLRALLARARQALRGCMERFIAGETT